jgi:tRNA threonylcarbamoyladenosine biosynthesis protein TsaB
VNCLAMDTATETMTVSAEAGEACAALTLRRGLQHSPALLTVVESLLRQLSLAPRDLQLIICSVGPGSFTGIRIGLATAQGISFSTGCPLVGVSTLDALALAFTHFRGDVYPVIDARKGRYYTTLYRRGERVGGYLDLAPQELRERLAAGEGALLAGPDAGRILSSLYPSGGVPPGVSVSTLADPSALRLLGVERFRRDGAVPESLVPLYLRESEAEITAGRSS